MHKFLDKVKDMLIYDADREFYAKVFPGSVSRKDLMKIRRMDVSDLPGVMEIEGKNYNYPWSENIFKDCLRALNYSCWVCEEQDQKVVGYCIVSIAAGEAHIMNLCVDPAVQGQGAGRKLLEKMIEISRGKAERMFLEVRPSNARAIGLYRSLGFNEIGIRKDYYPAKNGREDAVMLALELVPML
ncbi:ribosomal protein S18-alanine N-acetyltransferase [Methylomarinum sp. Ch1-1]|uniref:[Ribosomal protein bS18]-alanine N-acetyltransferase n=1 Tax=Methylomarinum roseum TaxID=3067653 RepID=A0AAU7NZ06_9GAMM|nr:ribosomal protein S18-alanine N-acetyltransferase [Methylomarinum sp. Ch1-1]MDP4521637.1 ribosomal protein S18-alanine N-acetyltransferase [Methylomarinum sp. Ch1-1]